MARLSRITKAAWFEPFRTGLRHYSVTETKRDDRLALRDLPRAASLLVIVVTSVYVATALSVAPHTRLIVLTALIPVFVLAALVKPVPHPLGGILAANSAASMVAVLIWTPPEVLLGVGIGSIVGQRIFRQVEWWRAVNNAASWGLSGGVDAAVAQSIMAIVPHGTFRIACGALAAMLAHLVTNRGMFALYRSCRFRRGCRDRAVGFAPASCPRRAAGCATELGAARGRRNLLA